MPLNLYNLYILFKKHPSLYGLSTFWRKYIILSYTIAYGYQWPPLEGSINLLWSLIFVSLFSQSCITNVLSVIELKLSNHPPKHKI